MQQTRAAPPASLDAVLERITYSNEGPVKRLTLLT
jgi:hypothetical protein